jgi:serine protease Do
LLASVLVAGGLVGGCRTAGNPEPSPAAQPEPHPSSGASEPEGRSGGRVVVEQSAVEELEVAFKRAIDRAGPAVVSVYTTRTRRAGPAMPSPLGGPLGGPPGGDPLFEHFFGLPGPGGLPGGQAREFIERGLGSGFVIAAEGLILTNNHVIAGADTVHVELADGRELEAHVVGADPPTDLALLEIDVTGAGAEAGPALEPIEMGDSSMIEVGDWVVAIGNPYGLPQTVSVGIVSAKGRADVGLIDFEDFIQTDAAINPGNSGGPIVDLDGRVVAISTAIASRGGGSEGVAFGIPIDMAKGVVEQLRSTGKVTRGNLGIVISPLDDRLAASFGYVRGPGDPAGILIQDVLQAGAAAQAGIQAGDVILRVDGDEVVGVSEFRNRIAAAGPGAQVRLEIWRGGATQTVPVTLGEAASAAKDPVAAAAADPGKPELGLGLVDLSPQLQRQLGLDTATGVLGVLIGEVVPGSRAAAAGLRPGDLLEQVGDAEVRDAADAARRLRAVQSDQAIRLRIRRDGVGRYVLVEPVS